MVIDNIDEALPRNAILRSLVKVIWFLGLFVAYLVFREFMDLSLFLAWPLVAVVVGVPTLAFVFLTAEYRIEDVDSADSVGVD